MDFHHPETELHRTLLPISKGGSVILKGYPRVPGLYIFKLCIESDDNLFIVSKSEPINVFQTFTSLTTGNIFFVKNFFYMFIEISFPLIISYLY